MTAEPTVNKDRSLIESLTLTQSSVEAALVADIAEYFTPASGLVITAKAVPDNVVELADAASADSGIIDDLDGTPKNVGSAVITVKATDTLGQYFTQTIAVTVNAP